MKNKNTSIDATLTQQENIKTGVAALAAESLVNNSRLRRRVQVANGKPSLTKKAFKDECDINAILARYNKTGQLPDSIKQNPRYGDFSDPSTYQESLNTVLFAQEQFSQLSSRVRERFQNDPQKFLEFTADPKNMDEMVKLGLATKRQTNQTNDEQSKDPKDQQTSPKKDSAPDSK